MKLWTTRQVWNSSTLCFGDIIYGNWQEFNQFVFLLIKTLEVSSPVKFFPFKMSIHWDVKQWYLVDGFLNKTHLPSRKQNMTMARMIAMIITTTSGRISIRRNSIPKSLTEESYTGAMYVDSSNPSPLNSCLVALLTTTAFLLLSIYEQKWRKWEPVNIPVELALMCL